MYWAFHKPIARFTYDGAKLAQADVLFLKMIKKEIIVD